MAILKSDGLELHIEHTGCYQTPMGWLEVYYEIDFLWQGQQIINHQINRYETKGFYAEDIDTSRILTLFQKVLKTDKSDYWENMAEPHLTLAIYPEEYFPFIKSHNKIIESEEARKKREKRIQLKKEKKQLPDDSYTIIAEIDAFNFTNATLFYGQGIALHIIVERDALELFTKALENEFRAILEQEGRRLSP